MENVKVSIIIPAYNAEHYIERCINSAIHQTLREIEIIIVDDGSLDQTARLCSRFQDNRITVLYQNNAGAASARNLGLDKASGEYIGFIDSDDYADPKMFETLYTIAKRENADIVNCLPKTVDEADISAVIPEGVFGDYKVESYTGSELEYMIKTANTTRILWFAIKGIYRRSMVQEHKIRFPENLSLGEETPFVLECLLCAKTIAKTEQQLYYYVQRKGSITKTIYKEGYFEKLNRLYLAKKAVYIRYAFIEYEPDLHRYTMEHTIPMIISNELSSGKTKNALRQEFKAMRDTEMVSEAFKNVGISVIHSKLRYLAMLLKYRQYMLLSLLCK